MVGLFGNRQVQTANTMPPAPMNASALLPGQQAYGQPRRRGLFGGAGNVDLGRALTFLTQGTNGLDRVDARRAAEANAPRLAQEREQILSAIQDPRERALFLQDPSAWAENVGYQFRPRTLAPGSVERLGGQTVGAAPVIERFDDRFGVMDPLNPQAGATYTQPRGMTEAERTTRYSAKSQANLGQGRLQQEQQQFEQRLQLDRETMEANRGASAREREINLRKEFQALPEVRAFNEVDAAYQNVRSAAQNESAAGDLSLIFAYMKMLDPGSVVREQEFANAQNAAGVPDQIRNLYNRALSGERLNPNQRQDFVGQAERLYNNRRARYDQIVSEYQGLASEYGAEPERVVGRGRERPGQQRQPAQGRASGPIAVNPQTGQRVQWNGSQWVPAQ